MERAIIWLRHGALVIEWVLGLLWYVVMLPFPRRLNDAMVEVYNVISFPGGVEIMGRVLIEKQLAPPSEEDSRWVNFKRMASHWFTRELAGADVEVTIGERSYPLKSNDEGYFNKTIYSEAPVEKVKVGLLGSDEIEMTTVGAAKWSARWVVISDVDDTLMETGSISVWRMVKTTLFGNSLTRELVPGMSSLMRDLADDAGAAIFYVTSSPWNLAVFLKRVFKRAKLPLGGIFMTDWGLTPEQWITPSHDEHKRAAIDRVVKWYPSAKIIMLGDDSQRDPEIYLKALNEYGGERVAALLVRSVSGESRARQVEGLFGGHSTASVPCAEVVKDGEAMRRALVRAGVLKQSVEKVSR